MLPYLHSQGGVSRHVSPFVIDISTNTHNFIVPTTANTKSGISSYQFTAIT